MDVTLKFSFFSLFLFGLVGASVLPVEKCKLTDSPCMVAQFQKALPVFLAGIPDQGIDVLDVMEMDEVKFDLSGLQFTLKDGRLKGLKTSIIDDVKWDVSKRKVDIYWHADCTVKGHYTAGGRILILPITGDGQMKLKLKNIAIKLHTEYNLEKDADGRNRAVLKTYKVDFDVKDNAHFTLTNLFNGNKELSDAMHKFLNENWKQISVEFGRPMLDVAANIIFKNVQKFLKSSALDDIATS